jgi:hypothetical protein
MDGGMGGRRNVALAGDRRGGGDSAGGCDWQNIQEIIVMPTDPICGMDEACCGFFNRKERKERRDQNINLDGMLLQETAVLRFLCDLLFKVRCSAGKAVENWFRWSGCHRILTEANGVNEA